MEFLEKLRKECHWLHLMSETLCARCTVCMGKNTEPCPRHEESSCRHHDCGHYIPLDGRLLCCKPGEMLEKELLEPWIKAIEHVSKVRYVLPTPSLAPQGRVGENRGNEFSSLHVQKKSEHLRYKLNCQNNYLKSFFFLHKKWWWDTRLP